MSFIEYLEGSPRTPSDVSRMSVVKPSRSPSRGPSPSPAPSHECPTMDIF